MARSRRPLVLLLLFGVLLLAACRQREEKPPAPTLTPPPTIPPVITRVVTPLPTSTPQPTPTLAYDIDAAEGRWLLHLEITITGGAFAQELYYIAPGELNVSLDGTVTGGGTFAQSITNPGCDARVEEPAGLSFTIQGATLAEGGQVVADVRLVPDDPEQTEHYLQFCSVDPGAALTFDQPVLWPALLALQRRGLTGGWVEGLAWHLALQNGQNYHLESDLSQETGGVLAGYMSLNASLFRAG